MLFDKHLFWNVGASGSKNLSMPRESAESQQQPSRHQTAASADDGHNGSQQQMQQPLPDAAPSRSFVPSNPLWFPPQYEPNTGSTQPDLSLHTREVVWVLDAGLEAHKGKAILDTGTRLTSLGVCLL